ncbi:MAG: hypothetical protein EKK41_19620 [Hyphomicrobiales bacterium]|nr:MAG: hypothetical protein EKK41_19620 [Hyphomicrobiales bacterium]
MSLLAKIIRIYSATDILISAFVAFPAHADPLLISELLRQGYEVRAAYSQQTLKGSTATAKDYNSLAAGDLLHFLVLQKGATIYNMPGIRRAYPAIRMLGNWRLSKIVSG